MNVLPLGIDVAKLKFNACLIREDGKSRHKVFANTQVGFSQLAAWLIANDAPRVHACLESTGTYGEALATRLADAGHLVSVARPGGDQGVRRLPALPHQDRQSRRTVDWHGLIFPHKKLSLQ